MLAVVRCDAPWLDFDLAGRSPRARLTRALAEIGAEVHFLAPDQLPEQWPDLWLEGLFPLLESQALREFLQFAHSAGGARWTAAANGGLFCPKKPAALGTPDLAELAGLTPFPLVPPLALDGPADLGLLGRAAYALEARRLAAAGALLLCPDLVFAEPEVVVGAGTVLAPNVTLAGKTTLGRGVRIETGACLRDAVVADGAVIKAYTVVEGAEIGPGAAVGPFAHLRAGTVLEAEVKVGNFVETKQIHMGHGSKASHLSYLGDARIGADCNIGAGTITCNYDGYNKSLTVLGDRVFIGSDSQLVAPVTLGDDAYVAAGSTVVADVPAGALALSRTPQVNKPNASARLREKARLKYERARSGRSDQ